MKSFIREAVKFSSRWALILYDRDRPTRSLSVDGARIKSLISVQSTFAAIFVMVTIAWAYTRYQNFKITSELKFKNLELRVLKDDVSTMRRNLQTMPFSESDEEHGSPTPRTSDLGGAYSYFPGLQGGFTDGSIQASYVKAEFDTDKKELGIDFEILRSSPREGRTDFYWFVALSGPGYLHTFPSVLRFRNGDLVEFDSGQSLQNVSSSRKITARFQLPLIEIPKDLGGLELTFFLYDLRGSLVLSQRATLAESNKKQSHPKTRGQ